MVGARCVVNKGACFLSFSLAYLIILLFNNLTSSNSINFKLTNSNNFGVIIDAGSTGSRLFLYKWSSKSDKELIDIQTVIDSEGKPIVRKVTPGLSSFAKNPEQAPEYILPLLEYASEHIPKERQAETPVFIFATAGMRLLSIEQQDGIVHSLRKMLPTLTTLKIESDNIKVIPGKWEGIYSWIAVNYMLGRFNFSNLPDIDAKSSDQESDRPKTAGMIDMGGASTQIAFELPIDGGPSQEGSNEKQRRELEENDQNVQLVNLGSRNEDRRFLYRIFVTTFLGFGVNEGAKKYEKFLWKQLEERRGNQSVPYISDGCLPAEFLKLTSIEEVDEEEHDGSREGEEGQESQFVRKGDGNWDQCVHDIAKLIFADYPNCPITKSCFFGGIKVPSNIRLSNVELYGFSEYWYSVDDVLSLGGLYEHDKFEAKAKEFCKQKWRMIKKEFRAKLYPKADEDRIETQCFKSAWIHAILHNGFYVDEMHHHFQSAFRINGQEVQWALGAMIYQQRYFPRNAMMEDSSQKDAEQRVGQKLYGRSAQGWTVFYLLAILAMLFLLWRIWRAQKVNQSNGGARKLPRYKRLETSNV